MGKNNQGGGGKAGGRRTDGVQSLDEKNCGKTLGMKKLRRRITEKNVEWGADRKVPVGNREAFKGGRSGPIIMQRWSMKKEGGRLAHYLGHPQKKTCPTPLRYKSEGR